MTESILLLVADEVHLPAIVGFDIQLCFTLSGPVRIKAIGGEFRERFLKTADASTRAKYTALRVRKLAEPLPQGRIYEILRSRVGDVGLVDLWRALCKQPEGEEGALDVTGKPNVFMMRDVEGKLCAVNVWWDEGWHIDTWTSPETVWPKGSSFLCH